MTRIVAIAREAFSSAWSQPVVSAVTILIVAGMCASVLLTTGRTVGAEQTVLGSLDSAGTRSIVVRAEPDAGLDASALNRIAHLDGVEWAGGFGPATDVQNASFLDGTRVPLRTIYSADLGRLGIDDSQPAWAGSAVGSEIALTGLGLVHPVGGVVASESGADSAIVGEIAVPDFLAFLEPLLVVPAPVPNHSLTEASGAQLSVLVVIASKPDLVTPVSDAVLSVLAVDDPQKVKVSTSEQLAHLRALIEGQLGSFGRNLVLVIFAVTGTLVAVILYGLVMLRRKDFGRRRALGASQGLIVALLLVQVAALSVTGAVLGCLAAAVGLIASGDPLPATTFFLAVAVLAAATGVIAALVPALAAARRDPLKELRVP